MKYRTIVADPPWAYDDGFITMSRSLGKGWQGPDHRYWLDYNSMSVPDICQLPVLGLADADCRLFLWATNRYMPAALGEVLPGWGFRYKQTLVWEKIDSPLNGSLAPNAEFLIVATRGTPQRLGRLRSSVIRHSQTKTHSQKPDVFNDWIEQVSPGPYVELFARRHRLGWDTWGLEAANTAEFYPDEATV